MRLINYEINVNLTWPANCFIIHAPLDDQTPTFALTDTKLDDPVVNFSAQDNEKLLQQLKSGFKGIINRSKYQSKVAIQERNHI